MSKILQSRVGSASRRALADLARVGLAAVSLAAVGLAGLLSTALAQGYPNAELLVEPAWLAERLDDSAVLVVDLRQAGQHRQAHVPGAVSLPVDAIVTTVAGVSFEFEAARVQEALRGIGLSRDHTVVVYDDLGMMNAARLFWTLEYVGHDDVRILHGGWNAWLEAGGQVEDGEPRATASDYEVELVAERLITADELAARLGDPRLAIADARSREEYLGTIEYGARGGRIPGAVHLPWFAALTGGDFLPTTQSGWPSELTDPDVERFKSPEELGEWLRAAGVTPDHEVVTYCQTFWRGAHLYFVLRLMGYDDVRGYDGSWAEWGNRLDLPIEVGEPAP